MTSSLRCVFVAIAIDCISTGAGEWPSMWWWWWWYVVRHRTPLVVEVCEDGGAETEKRTAESTIEGLPARDHDIVGGLDTIPLP